VDNQLPRAVEDDDGVVGGQPGDNRTADGTGAAGHDRDAVIMVGPARHAR
jgi:hypothetical protein